LVRSAGAVAVALVTGSRRNAEARYFVGRGKADEVHARVREHGAELAIFNHDLSPSQERNLEQRLGCRVLDRTGLILDIFAQRARSFEGKLQVELAQLKHLSTRLIRGWTHLERQKGGIGLRGPGETQLETDRRLIGKRIRQLSRRLARVERQREQGRRNRRRNALPSVALVGYTNAGKSTLFNRLAGAGVYSANKLFATLDPTIRRLALPGGRAVALADTVGFIRDLPHDLIAAFRATLKETREADVLLHVIDAADPNRALYSETVNQVLAEIGAECVPQLEVFNKIDLTEHSPGIEYGPEGQPRRVFVSATSGAGIEQLRTQLPAFFERDTVHGWLRLSPEQGRLRSLLFSLDAVLKEQIENDGASRIEVDLPRRDYQRLIRREGLEPSALV
jgi:GTP-binding protein HflX